MKSEESDGGTAPCIPHASPSAAQEIDVAAGLIFRNGRLLITQRPAGSHLAGLWEFPGGKREPGETWEDCLRRELREELGVEVAVGGLFEEVTHAYPNKTVKLRFFVCRLMRGEPEPLGCAAVAWVERERLTGFTFPPADHRLLCRLGEPGPLWDAEAPVSGHGSASTDGAGAAHSV